MSEFHKITLISKSGKYEDLIAKILMLGVDSFEEIENGLVFYTGEDLESNLQEIILEIEKKFLDIVINIEKFTEKNWNDLWEKSIEPVYIKNKIVIYPSWKRNEINSEIPVMIEIDPKMSFGTGHNETTQLVLEMMCDFLDDNDKSMLDFGSGTGILSIAGIKLGINNAIAIDIDNDAIENSKEYIRINNVSDSVKLYQCTPDEIRESDFDIIAANIISGVIKSNIRIIYSKLKPDGKLFLSGILIDEKNDITDFLIKNGFTVKNISETSEWLGIFCIKH